MKSWFIAKKAAIKSLIAVICVMSLVATGITGCGSSQPDEGNTVSNTVGDESSTVNETQQAGAQDGEADKLPALEIEEEVKPVEVDEDWPVEYLLADIGDGGAIGGGGSYPSRDGFEVYAFTPENVKCGYDNTNGFSIKISDTGSEDWHIQLKKSGVKVENGKWYQVTFDAKSSIDRSIMFSMQRDGSKDEDWRSYSGNKTVKLGNEWKPYTIIFQMTGKTDNRAVYNLSLGSVGGNRIRQQHTVNIKNMQLVELEDTWLDRVSQEGNLLKNPNFEYDDIAWNASVVEPGAANVKFENGKAVFDISNVGTTDWHIQLKQDSIKLEQGYNYRLTFKASSTAARSINIGFMDKDFVHWYGGGLEALNAGVERTVAVEFYMDKATNNDACMFISMGKIENMNTPASVITLGEFKLEKLTGRPVSSSASSGGGGWSAPVIALSGGWEVSYWGGQVGWCGEEAPGSYRIDISDTGSLDWHVQMQKKGIVLENGKRYRMSFDARSSVDRKIVCAIQKDGTNDDVWTSYSGGSGQYQLYGIWQTYTCEFTMSNATDRNAIYSISLGAVDREISNGHSVYLRNLRLEELPEPPIVSVPVGQEMLTGEWVLNEGPSGNSVTENNGKITAKIVDVGEHDYDVQIIQKNLTLEEGCTYEFKCNADFDNGQRIIKVGIMQDGTYDWYGGEDLTIGTATRAKAYSDQWMKFAGTTGKEYTFTFTMNKPTISNGMLVISMGKIDGRDTPTGIVTIDNISLKKIEKTEKPDEPIVNPVPDDQEMLTGEWVLIKGGNSITEVNGKITAKITDVGVNDYDVQVCQKNLTLEKGCTYEFKCNADFDNGERIIKVGVMQDGTYDWYDGTNLTIDGTNKEYTFTFTVTKPTISDGMIAISMGQIYKDDDKSQPIDTPTGTVNLSNISLKKTSEKAEEPNEPNPDESVLKLIADVEGNMLKGKSFAFSGSGAAIAKQDGTKFIIDNVGEEDWNVQLKCAELKLEEGCTYEFKCNADFDNGERIIKVGVMQDVTYDWYDGIDLTINGTTKEYTFSFTVTKPTISDGVLAISMGQIYKDDDKSQPIDTPTGTVNLSNISLKKTKDAETPDEPGSDESDLKLIADVEGNMFKDKTFAFNGSEGNGGAIAKQDGTKFTIDNVGEEDWNVQLKCSELKLEKGCTYEFKCNADFDNGERQIKVGVMQDVTYDWYDGTNLTINGTSKEYTFTFTVTKPTISDGVLAISMGQIYKDDDKSQPIDTPTGTVNLSNISLKKTKEAETPDEPDDPTMPIEGNILPELADEKGWALNLNEDAGQSVVKGSATMEYTEDGTVVIDISDVGNKAHSVQFALELVDSLKLEEGAEYKVYCDVESSVARPISIMVQKKGGDWSSYGALWSEKLSADTKKSFTFTFTKSDNLDAVFAVNLGQDDGGADTPTGTITLSRIAIVKIMDAPKPDESDLKLIADGDDNLLKGKIFEITNNSSDAVAELSPDKTKVTITNVGSEDWNIQLKLTDDSPKLKLEAGCTYEFTADAKFDAADSEVVKTRKIKVAFMSQSNGWYDGKESVITSTSSKIDAGVTMNTTDDNVKFVISMGNVSSEGDPTGTITLSNLSLVKTSGPASGGDDNPPDSGLLPSEITEANYQKLVAGSASATVNYSSNKVEFDIADVGSANWNVQLSRGLTLQKGHTYKFSFNAAFAAEGATERTIEVGYFDSADGWIDGGGTTTIGSNSKYEKEFTLPADAPGDNITIKISLGMIDHGVCPAGKVTLSGFSLVDITASTYAASSDEEISTFSSDAEIEASSLNYVAADEENDEVVTDEESEIEEAIHENTDEEPEQETDEEIQEDSDEEQETEEEIQEDAPNDSVTPETVDTSLNEDSNDSDDSN